MRHLVLAVAVAVALPAFGQDALPPPPPPPPTEVPLPPPPPGTRPLPATPGEAPLPVGADVARRVPGTIGEAPFAPAGSQAAPLHPIGGDGGTRWKMSLATGVAGRFGGLQLRSAEKNPGVLLYFGAQADGLWTEGLGRAARLRLRMFTGGESQVYVPSDGELEAAFMIGRREFRFVLGRLEVARYPALGVEVLAQLATLPCFEGSVALLGDTMRLYYYVSPVEAAYVRYYGRAHERLGPNEADRPAAATSGRLRWTVLLPPSVLMSLQGDLVKMWSELDLLVGAEGSLGYQAFDGSAVFNVAVRWDSFRRRGREVGSSATDSEMKLLGIATLVF